MMDVDANHVPSRSAVFSQFEFISNASLRCDCYLREYESVSGPANDVRAVKPLTGLECRHELGSALFTWRRVAMLVELVPLDDVARSFALTFNLLGAWKGEYPSCSHLREKSLLLHSSSNPGNV
jgi:hypothetical protein